MRLIQDKNLTVEGTVPVRLKGRGITVHRPARVPDPHLYEIQPGLWVGHPAIIRAMQEQIDREMQADVYLADLYKPVEDPALDYLKEHLR